MAVLSDVDRQLGTDTYVRDRVAVKDYLELTKADIRAAFDALDGYFNTNAAAINAVLPLPARTTLSVQQKARLLVAVVNQRYLAGS